MGIAFNAAEAFEMAEKIEGNGARFYRRAAELRPAAERECRDLLNRLAGMEDGHKKTFADVRRKLPKDLAEQTAFDPYMEASLYLNAMADYHGGEGSVLTTEALTGKETMEQILRTAIRMEEKSIVFYLGLRDMVPPNLGKDKIDWILSEEKRHIVDLAAELKKLAR